MDHAASQQSADGGYIVAGYTESKGDGQEDAWVLKLGPDGSLVCDKTFGGSSGDGLLYLLLLVG